eukprot:scaffold132480_cov54-Phaeocystis_antarctica.AAC.3
MSSSKTTTTLMLAPISLRRATDSLAEARLLNAKEGADWNCAAPPARSVFLTDHLNIASLKPSAYPSITPTYPTFLQPKLVIASMISEAVRLSAGQDAQGELITTSSMAASWEVGMACAEREGPEMIWAPSAMALR